MQRFSNFQPQDYNKPFSEIVHSLDDVAGIVDKEGLPPYTIQLNNEVFTRTETTATDQEVYDVDNRGVTWLYASTDGTRFIWIDKDGNVSE